MTNPQHPTRESWLQAIAARIVPLIEAHAEGRRMPAYRVSCGWPARSALARKHRRIGECWVQGGKFKEIFVTPTMSDGVKVADVLAHELCHAILPAGTGHKGPFAKLARAIGLEGKPTATVAGPDLRATLEKMVEAEGPYPHGAIEAPTNLPKQGTRQRLVECPACGAKWRAPRSTIERGLPTCACGVQMQAADEGEDVREPVRLVEQVTEYATEDGRFGLRRYVRKGAAAKWQLVDFEPEDGAGARLCGFFATEADLMLRLADVRDGTWTPADVEEREPEEWDEDDDLDYLDDDEDELPDYPEDQPVAGYGEPTRARDVLRHIAELAGEPDAARRFVTLPPTEDEYARMTELRERSGERKSEDIARGRELALD